MTTFDGRDAYGNPIALEKPLPPGPNTAAASRPVTTAIDEIRFVDVTLTLDTAAYAAGELIAEIQAVAGCVKANDARATLHSVVVIDEDDVGAAFTLYFLDANNSLGAENAIPSITDASARALLGFVDIATTDYRDLGGVKVAFKPSVGMTVKPAAGTSSIYLAAVLGVAGATYTANGLRVRLGFLG